MCISHRYLFCGVSGIHVNEVMLSWYTGAKRRGFSSTYFMHMCLIKLTGNTDPYRNHLSFSRFSESR